MGNEGYLDNIISILTTIKPIAEEFQKRQVVNPFNIILAASNLYYRENYHSYVMAYILKNKTEKTLKYFIEYINELSDMPKINKNDYLNTEIICEKDKIDILIRDLSSRHCIIVENKINNARDMERQLPRYYEINVKNEYIVDRILYYSIDGKKPIDKTTWSEGEKLELDKIIVYGAASNGSKNDYVNAFLIKCKNNTEDEQEKAFYSQYIDLLQFLRGNYMNDQLKEKFYKEMLKEKQYRSALSLRDMLNNFNEYRRDCINDRFSNNYSPFGKTHTAPPNFFGFEFIKDIAPEEDIKLDIIPEDNQTKIWFYVQDSKIKSDLIYNILKKIGEEKKFSKLEEINFYERTFKFPDEEDDMYEYVTEFLKLLDENKNKINQ
jgi:hypothetical protein